VAQLQVEHVGAACAIHEVVGEAEPGGAHTILVEHQTVEVAVGAYRRECPAQGQVVRAPPQPRIGEVQVERGQLGVDRCASQIGLGLRSEQRHAPLGAVAPERKVLSDRYQVQACARRMTVADPLTTIQPERPVQIGLDVRAPGTQRFRLAIRNAH